jgi:hypothetical protein
VSRHVFSVEDRWNADTIARVRHDDITKLKEHKQALNRMQSAFIQVSSGWWSDVDRTDDGYDEKMENYTLSLRKEHEELQNQAR